MATGKLAFDGESSGEICECHPAPKPRLRVTQLNPQLPRQVEDIIDKALEKDRDLRYQHCVRDASRNSAAETGHGITADPRCGGR